MSPSHCGHEGKKDIAEATIDRDLAIGAHIRWVTRGIAEPIVSTVHRVEPERLTLWGGPAMGITGLQFWCFEPAPSGTTVTTEEGWSGDPVDRNPKAMQSALDRSLQRWLDNLAAHLA